MSPKGPRKFAKFLADNGISKRRAARDLKVSAPTLLAWLTGEISPEKPNRKAIHVYTRGVVAEPDWETDADREAERRLAGVRPFDPTGTDGGSD